MSMFMQLLKEAVEETEIPETDAVEAEEEIEEITEPEVEDVEDEEVVEEESDLVSSVRDLIDSVLDAIEEEMVADGEPIEGSIDIGLELISKYADQIPTEALQSIFDEVSEYYETELIDGEEEPEVPEDEFFEEPIEDIQDEDEITVESILKKK